MEIAMMIVLATVPAILILFIVYGVSVHNSIIERFNKVKRSWSDVLVYEQQKNKIIPELESVVKKFSDYETNFQSKIVELRNSVSQLSDEKFDLDKLREVEKKSESLMKAINITVENYPELKADKMFSNLMVEITEQQENISSAIRIFNSNVEIFNTGIEVFPSSLVNDWFNKKESLNMFKTEAPSESGFTPDF